MKNAIILILSIITLSINTNNNNSEAKMFNKFKKGFYFEKYKTAEEAKEQLLKLHPIGSDVNALIKTLEGANSKFINSISRKDLLSNPVREREYFPIKTSKSAYLMNEYQYYSGIWIINPITWFVFIYVNKQNQITDLYLNKSYTGL